jgi:hypothetical protein
MKKRLKKIRLTRETLESFGGGASFTTSVEESQNSGGGCTVLTTCGGCTCESAG